MLTILGKPQRHPFCDGLRRRDFLKIGGLAMGGFSLPEFCGPRRRPAFATRTRRSS